MRAALVLSASSTGAGSTEVVIATLVASTWLVEVELAAGEDSETPDGDGGFGDLSELLKIYDHIPSTLSIGSVPSTVVASCTDRVVPEVIHCRYEWFGADVMRTSNRLID